MANTLLACILFMFLTLFFTMTEQKFSEMHNATEADHQLHVHKMSHLHFYLHEIISGNNPSAITVAGNISKFGDTVVLDDPLTEGPEPRSKIVGRAQGMYIVSSHDGTSLLFLVNFAFNEGIYNGSSVSVHGRNPFLEKVREMPVVGGSGVFRFARGYAMANTTKFNATTGDAVVEYNVRVMHH